MGESANLEGAIDAVDFWLGVWHEANDINRSFPEDIRDRCNASDADTATQLRQLTVILAMMSDKSRAEVIGSLRCVRRELALRYVATLERGDLATQE